MQDAGNDTYLKCAVARLHLFCFLSTIHLINCKVKLHLLIVIRISLNCHETIVKIRQKKMYNC